LKVFEKKTKNNPTTAEHRGNPKKKLKQERKTAQRPNQNSDPAASLMGHGPITPICRRDCIAHAYGR
jgi:hypothetical protein